MNEEEKEQLRLKEEAEAKAKAEADAQVLLDYKALYEQEIEKGKKEDYTWEKLRDENKTLKEKLSQVESGTFDPEMLTETVKVAVQSAISPLRQELLKDKFEADLSKYTDDPHARELIKLKLGKNPGLSVEEAWFLINKPRFEGQLSEIKRAKESESDKGSGAGAGQKPKVSKKPVISDKDLQMIQQMGYIWNEKDQLYEDTNKENRATLKIDPVTNSLVSFIKPK